MVLRITVTPGMARDGSGGDPGNVSDDPLAAIADERLIESALVERVRATERDAALTWLDDTIGTPSQPLQTSAGGAGEPATEGAGGGAAVVPKLRRQMLARQPAAEQRATIDVAPIARDLGRGLVEAPRQVLGGVRDAAQAAINLGDWLADNLEAVAPLGGFQLFDAAGNFALARIPAGDPRLAPSATGATLPDVKHATTVTGGLVRGVSQFLTGFAAGGPVAGAVAKGGTFTKAALQGALSDFVAHEGAEANLARLLRDHAELSDPVTAFLATAPGDNEAVNRLRRSVEGMGLGVLAEGLIRGVRYVRDARRAVTQADVSEAAARSAAQPREAQPLTLLGDESRGLLEQGKSLPGSSNASAAADLPAGGKTNVRPSQSLDLGVPDDVAARSLARDALVPLSEGDNGVYVNFARFNTDEDVRRVIATTAIAFKADIDTARRGVRSNLVTRLASGKEDAWKLLSERRRGEPLNAEESLAARRLWEASAAKLLEVSEAAVANATPENLYQFRKMVAIHHTIQREVIAARTETARALQSWAIPVGAGGVERLRSIENILTSNGGSETALELARRVSALGNVPHGLAALDDIAERGAFAKSTDVAKELFINSILSGPQTHMVNMVGNAATLGQELIERAVTARWSQAFGSGTVQVGEAAARAYGQVMAIREGMRMFGLALRSGESQFGATTSKTAEAGFQRAISSAHLGIDPGNPLAKAVDYLGAVANLPTRFLTAEDDFFKSIGYRGELHAQAFRQASAEVSDGVIAKSAMHARIAELVANPPEHIKLSATDSALYLTFTNKPGKIAEAINHLDRRIQSSGHAGGQLGSLAMRYVIPFRNTLANISAYGLERTPVAPLLQRYQEAVAQGGAAADIARTRMAFGSFTLLGVMDLAFDGHVTGSGPSWKDSGEKGVRQTLDRAGWQPYSIRVGDRYFSYKRTDPIGLSLGIAADIAQQINNSPNDEDAQDDLKRIITVATASFGNQMLDKHYMSGLSQIFDVLSNPASADRYLDRRAGAYVPALLAQVRRVSDPYMRYTAGAVDELRNRTPGLSSDLPVARDFWGRPRSYQSGLGTVYDAISPIASRRINPEPVDREAIAHDFNLSMPQWALTSAGVRVSLRDKPEAYSRYLEVRGTLKPSEMGATLDAKRLVGRYGDQPLLPLLNDIVEGRHALSEQYARADGGRNNGKDRLITRIVGEYSRAARLKVLDEFPDLPRRRASGDFTGVLD